MNPEHAPLIEMKNIEKHFGSVIALNGVSLEIYPGECHCLLGDNGAGKSTFIKTMSGVHKPTRGEILFEGKPMHFEDPRDAITAGHRHRLSGSRHDPADVGEPQLLHGQRAREEGSDRSSCSTMTTPTEITMQEMRKMGINLRGPDQAVGTLSGGERQTVAIARAVHFGAKVLILDEPTSALGVRQTANVLATIDKVRKDRASPWSSSPTMSAMRWPWATASPCSTAARRWEPPSAARSRPTNCRT
jgi:simple sugar transport system ATP-binding protein